MTRRPSEPPTVCALPSVLASDRSSRADAFVQAHAFVDVPEDALHAVAVFAIEYFERLGLSAWSDFPVEAFAGVHLPGELYGFDSLRVAATRALPFFFAWLPRLGVLTGVEAAALSKRARDIHQGAYRPTAGVGAAGPSLPSLVPRPGLPRGVAS